MKQPRNPWSDGPEYITQCPIEPGTNFTYEVIFSKEEGTLWWHAHSDWTRSSVHGAIVVYPGDGTSYPYPTPDDEEVIVLGKSTLSYEKVLNILILNLSCTLNLKLRIFFVLVHNFGYLSGSWYIADVNQEVAEDLVTGADTPRSNSYVINGQPGDFANCSRSES